LAGGLRIPVQRCDGPRGKILHALTSEETTEEIHTRLSCFFLVLNHQTTQKTPVLVRLTPRSVAVGLNINLEPEIDTDPTREHAEELFYPAVIGTVRSSSCPCLSFLSHFCILKSLFPQNLIPSRSLSLILFALSSRPTLKYNRYTHYNYSQQIHLKQGFPSCTTPLASSSNTSHLTARGSYI
jgi:hypothetical protein